MPCNPGPPHLIESVLADAERHVFELKVAHTKLRALFPAPKLRVCAAGSLPTIGQACARSTRSARNDWNHPRQPAFERVQRARAGVAFGHPLLEILSARPVHPDLHNGDAVNSGAELPVTPPGWSELHADRSRPVRDGRQADMARRPLRT
jgi:hypothetical protein